MIRLPGFRQFVLGESGLDSAQMLRQKYPGCAPIQRSDPVATIR